jgi:recombination protein RecR
MRGIGPEQLHIKDLYRRLADGSVQEVILATDPNTEGEATAAYLGRQLATIGVSVTRLASGLPMGGDLELADEVTLGRAFVGRRRIDE